MENNSVKLVSCDLRDGQQACIATRMTTTDMLPVLEPLDQFGFAALEEKTLEELRGAILARNLHSVRRPRKRGARWSDNEGEAGKAGEVADVLRSELIE